MAMKWGSDDVARANERRRFDRKSDEVNAASGHLYRLLN